jgi:hypothetical protein
VVVIVGQRPTAANGDEPRVAHVAQDHSPTSKVPNQ